MPAPTTLTAAEAVDQPRAAAKLRVERRAKLRFVMQVLSRQHHVRAVAEHVQLLARNAAVVQEGKDVRTASRRPLAQSRHVRWQLRPPSRASAEPTCERRFHRSKDPDPAAARDVARA